MSGYRSNLERDFNRRFKLPYETVKLKYTVEHTYTPDLLLAPNVHLELKGLFVSADRAKHLHIKKQHPNVKVLFVFQDAHRRLTRTSKTTYAEWCAKHGFAWVDVKDTHCMTTTDLLNIVEQSNGN